MVEFHETEPLVGVTTKTKCKAVSVTAILHYPNTSMLCASVGIEGNNQRHNTRKDYSKGLVNELAALASK